MKKIFTVSLLVCVAVMTSSCFKPSSVTPDVLTPAVAPAAPVPAAPAPVVVPPRLIFSGETKTGETIKIELKDAVMEGFLDGNTSYQGNTKSILDQSVSYHKSPIRITITNLFYYGETIDQLTCAEDANNKISLNYEGPDGNYVDGQDGKLYRSVPGGIQNGTVILPKYVEQGANETITDVLFSSAKNPELTLYVTKCTDSKNNKYELTFYTPENPVSHAIQTKFSIADGSQQGLVRVHREGDGYVPGIDLVF